MSYISNVELSRCALQNARRPHPAGDLRAIVPRRREDGRSADSAGRNLPTGRIKAPGRSETGWPGALPARGPSDALQRAAQRLGPADRLDPPDGRVLGEKVRRPRKPAEEDGPMNEPPAATRSVVVERDIPHSPEKIW